MIRTIAIRRTPRGVIEYFADDSDNVYVSMNYGELKLLGRINWEPNVDTEGIVVDGYFIEVDVVNGFPPETLPYPEED